ncbi:hypothetical protein HY642_00920 [Candidatus Woesearchaeota archaeon]|nr:hypothetical protein [Candidatus Woesearchaeota archaeon]
MNRKGIELTMTTIIIAILLLLVLLWYTGALAKIASFFSSAVTPETIRQKIQGCEIITSRQRGIDNDFPGKTGDGLADTCDICLGGDDHLDQNNNGIPDACDCTVAFTMDGKCGAEDKDWAPAGSSLKAACNKAKMCEKDDCWNDAKGQCVLPCYADGCPPIAAATI